jgi:tetratricopeptide (TPR) repeat protein
VIIKSKDLVNQIQSDQTKRIKKKTDETLSINIFNTDRGQSTTGLNGQFIHSQLLIDCLLRMKESTIEKNDLISLCKEQYKGNPHELSIINDFEKNYTSYRAIWWYTRQSFLYRLLNKALRVQNVDLIYLFRFFIRDINHQLKELNTCSTPIHVYRGQLMVNDELQILKDSIGKYISINSFFSTSLNRDLALVFSRDSNHCERVLFEIEANPQTNDGKLFADISTYSYFPDESEVLFMLGSIFRLRDIVLNDDGLWVIGMALSSGNDHDLKPIFEHMKNQHGQDKTDLLSFGHVLRDMGKFDEAENYYRRLLYPLPTDSQELGRCYHALGIIAYEKGDYESSLKWHQNALEQKLRSLKSDDPQLANSYNSIGTIYERKKDYTRALQSFHKSLNILQQAFGDDHPRVAICLNNIAGIYQTEKRYNEALEYNKRALNIREKHLPADHPDLGASHSNIGITYRCLGQYDLAIDHHNRSLNIHQKSLPPQHPQIASTLNNVGLVHEDKSDYQQALGYYERAAVIYRHALPPTHPNIVKTDVFIQRVSSKMK